jgi:hypothetical protein
VIVRILDEMPLSIETDPSASQGLVPNHFAYRVEGAPFSVSQSEAWQADGDSSPMPREQPTCLLLFVRGAGSIALKRHQMGLIAAPSDVV